MDTPAIPYRLTEQARIDAAEDRAAEAAELLATARRAKACPETRATARRLASEIRERVASNGRIWAGYPLQGLASSEQRRLGPLVRLAFAGLVQRGEVVVDPSDSRFYLAA